MDHGWHIDAGLEQAMHKNFLVVKGMTLMGEGGLKFKRFASKYHDASRTLPRRYEQSSGSIIQITMLVVDVALKLKLNEGNKIRSWVIPIGLDFHLISPPSNQTQY